MCYFQGGWNRIINMEDLFIRKLRLLKLVDHLEELKKISKLRKIII